MKAVRRPPRRFPGASYSLTGKRGRSPEQNFLPIPSGIFICTGCRSFSTPGIISDSAASVCRSSSYTICPQQEASAAVGCRKLSTKQECRWPNRGYTQCSSARASFCRSSLQAGSPRFGPRSEFWASRRRRIRDGRQICLRQFRTCSPAVPSAQSSVSEEWRAR